MRTALCIIGVTLAATFVVAIGATTMRYATVIREMNVLFNGQVMVVTKGTIIVQAIPINLQGGMLKENLANQIGNVTGAERTIPVILVTNQIDTTKNLDLVPVNFTIAIPLGDWQSALGPIMLKGSTGRMPADDLQYEVVVGASLADQNSWKEGSKIALRGHTFNVTGVLDTKMALLGRSIVMPLKIAQTVYTYPKSVNIIAVKPAQGFTQEQLSNNIEQQIDSVDALTQRERNDVVEPVLAQIETWNTGIEAVVFVISLILVMTVTLMSVSERRRDFATLDAIGAPLSYVFRVVIFETVLVGVLGGVLGLFFGSLTAVVLASLFTSIPLAQFFPSVLEIVPPLYMVQIFVSVVAVCTLAGIIPAANAARTRIAEVLRAEY